MTTVTATGAGSGISTLLSLTGTAMATMNSDATQLMNTVWDTIGKIGSDIKSGDVQTQLSGLGLDSLQLIFTKSLKGSLTLDVASLHDDVLQLNSASYLSADGSSLSLSISGAIRLNKLTGVLGGSVSQLDATYTDSTLAERSISLKGRMFISDHSIISGTINRLSMTDHDVTAVLTGAINVESPSHSLISGVSLSDQFNNGVSWKGSMTYADLQSFLQTDVSIGSYFSDSPFAAKLFAGHDVFRIMDGDLAGAGSGLEQTSWKAYAGNDVMIGGASKEVFYGGIGNDRLSGYGADDSLYGEQGNDILNGGDGNDLLDAGDGNNQLDGGLGDDVMKAANGNDRYRDSGGNNVITDTGGNNVISTGDGNDTITTGAGNDVIRAGNGTNIIKAAGGNNQISSGSGSDFILADAGNDIIRAGDGDNQIFASGGNNQVFGGNGRNTIITGSGNDLIKVGSGGSGIIAGGGNDKITTGEGDDSVYGEAGDDVIFTQGGSDRLSGGTGIDKLTGGAGKDYFYLADLQTDGSILGYDTLTDFDSDEGDQITLQTSLFKKLAGLSDVTGHLVSSNLAVALDADDYLIFDQTTKKLYYDPDGNGDGAALHVATLIGVAQLNPEDFTLLP